MGIAFSGKVGEGKGHKKSPVNDNLPEIFWICFFELIYFNSANCCSIALIFASASACFLRSFSTT